MVATAGESVTVPALNVAYPQVSTLNGYSIVVMGHTCVMPQLTWQYGACKYQWGEAALKHPMDQLLIKLS